MARCYLSRFECAEPGCHEIANFESSTRRDQAEVYRRNAGGKWRCTRHSQPDLVLSVAQPKRVTDAASKRLFSDRGNDIGLYWGGANGFFHGPGFMAWAKDFPEGTILRVTAEIILPADTTS